MIYRSEQFERKGVLEAAERMCIAARTAPKAKGQDYIETLIVDGVEKDALADKMRAIAITQGRPSLERDAANVDASGAVVIIGILPTARGLNCAMCGFANCDELTRAGGCCVFDGIDLGIALGSAAATAADIRVDTRIMFSIGLAAAEMGWFGQKLVLHGIPVSISGKSPFFDRK